MVRKETQISEAIPKRFPITDAIWKSIGQNKMQLLFLTLLIIGLPFLAFFLHEFDSIFQMRVTSNPSYDWPKYSDLNLAFLSAFIILVLYYFVKITCTEKCESMISAKYTGQERQDRAEKMVKSLYKGIYFLFSSVFAYCISKDSFFMPASLGGSGNVNNTFDGYPYFDKTNLPYMKEYFMVQLGYHIASFVMLFIGKMRNDFIEMLLHHTITVFLLSLAYLMNYWTISLMILFTHDISDGLVYFTRVFVDTDRWEIALSFYLILMVSWVYLRLIIFPFDLIRISCYENPKFEEIYGLGILGSMAHVLALMHVYWFVLLFQMGLRYARTRVANDTQNDMSQERYR